MLQRTLNILLDVFLAVWQTQRGSVDFTGADLGRITWKYSEEAYKEAGSFCRFGEFERERELERERERT